MREKLVGEGLRQGAALWTNQAHPVLPLPQQAHPPAPSLLPKNPPASWARQRRWVKVPPSPGYTPTVTREAPASPPLHSQWMQGPWPNAASPELWEALVKEKGRGSAIGQ